MFSDHTSRDIVRSDISFMAEEMRVTCGYPLVMLELGWPPAEGFTTDQQLRIVAEYERTRTSAVGRRALAASVEADLLALYGPDRLRRLHRDWSARAFLSGRMPILTQVIEAHIVGSYFVSIPTTLAQIEGLLVDGVGHKGYMSLAHYKRYVFDLFPSQVDRRTNRAVRSYILTVLLAKFHHGEPLPRGVSRHAVLHGADTAYGTAANSLRAILLFDFIQRQFQFVGSRRGGHYHIPGCSKLRQSTAPYATFSSESDAREEKTPCRYCLPPGSLRPPEVMPNELLGG